MAAIGFPPHILALFQPRVPVEPLPAIPFKRSRPYDGIATFTELLETTPPPPVIPFETPRQRWARKKREKLTAHLQKQKENIAAYNPQKDPKLSGDPFCTLFVGKLNFETTEKKLKREFEQYGPIRKIRIMYDPDGKSRGYAFIEYENDRDMKEAYKKADGTKLDGRRVLVDVERARTVPGWLPRRLGGGRGPPRGGGKGAPDIAALTLLAHSSTNNSSRDDRDKRSGRDRERKRSRSRERRDKRR